MRLINTKNFQMKEFLGEVPPYAILSHTWEEEEVTFLDFQTPGNASQMRGYAKILGTCKQALENKIEWCWVDTCCIDKTSSAELTEAINSMFLWYQNAAECYVYLADVEAREGKELIEQLRMSRWFTRGWTLQELLAPVKILFFANDWSCVGTKTGLLKVISDISGIARKYLREESILSIWDAAISERMSWMAKRRTTRLEDQAYCLLGIFECNMPLLYGEGTQAFRRLQEEIMKYSNDQTIFCWEWTPEFVPSDWRSILAPNAQVFANGGNFYRAPQSYGDSEPAFHITNAGLSAELQVVPAGLFNLFSSTRLIMATLRVTCSKDRQYGVCIPLRKERGENFQRINLPAGPLLVVKDFAIKNEKMYIECKPMSDARRLNHMLYVSLEQRVQNLMDFRRTTGSSATALRSINETFSKSDGFKLLLITNITRAKGLELLQISYKTNNVTQNPMFDSLINFSDLDTNENDTIGITKLSLRMSGTTNPFLLLGVRSQRLDTGNLRHSFLCRIINQSSSKDPESIAKSWRENGGDFTFDSQGAYTVMLDEPFSLSSFSNDVGDCRIAYLAYDDESLSKRLKEIHEAKVPTAQAGP